MWQYVLLLLRRQPGKSALVSGGFLLAACALILLSATTQTTLVRGNQIISQNWRPTYDLVVLPPQAKIPANPPFHLICLQAMAVELAYSNMNRSKTSPALRLPLLLPM